MLVHRGGQRLPRRGQQGPRPRVPPAQQRRPLLRRRPPGGLPPAPARGMPRRLRRRGRRRPALRRRRVGRGGRLAPRGARLPARAPRRPGDGDTARHPASRGRGDPGGAAGVRSVAPWPPKLPWMPAPAGSSSAGDTSSTAAAATTRSATSSSSSPSPHGPRICLLPTASGDPEDQIAQLPPRLRRARLQSLGGLPVPPRERADRSAASTCSPRTRSTSAAGACSIWSRSGRPTASRRSCESAAGGHPLCGQSAGAMCWFEQGVTRSSGQPAVAAGFGLLPEAPASTIAPSRSGASSSSARSPPARWRPASASRIRRRRCSRMAS